MQLTYIVNFFIMMFLLIVSNCLATTMIVKHTNTNIQYTLVTYNALCNDIVKAYGTRFIVMV